MCVCVYASTDTIKNTRPCVCVRVHVNLYICEQVCVPSYYTHTHPYVWIISMCAYTSVCIFCVVLVSCICTLVYAPAEVIKSV